MLSLHDVTILSISTFALKLQYQSNQVRALNDGVQYDQMQRNHFEALVLGTWLDMSDDGSRQLNFNASKGGICLWYSEASRMDVERDSPQRIERVDSTLTAQYDGIVEHTLSDSLSVFTAQ